MNAGSAAAGGIAVHELGGSGPDVLFVHASGFHGRTWAPVARHLAQFRCLAVDVRGHGDSERLPEGGLPWERLADDLLAVCDSLVLDLPCGVGHSSGASLLLLAEERRPGTFARLVCFEPIGSTVASGDPPPPDFERPIAAAARRRRQVFSSKEEALRQYSSKPPMASLAPEALEAYVEHGFAGDGGRLRIKCHPDDEAAVYAHGFSHPAFRDLSRLGCPVVFVRGELSDTVDAETLRRWAARAPSGSAETLAAVGHLAPMEDPAGVAAALGAWLGGSPG